MKRNRWDARQGIHAPLVVLVGLPHPICAAVARVLENRLSPSPQVIFQPSGADNRELYKKQSLTELMAAVTGFAVKHLRAEAVRPTPTQILLAYVPAADEEQLLAEFDFFVFPVRLTSLAQYDAFGRQFRYNREFAEDYAFASLETALGTFTNIKRRLSSPSHREPLFLPPRNFNVSNATRIADVFREMRLFTRPWAPPIADIRTTKVTHEQLERISHGAHKEVLCDARNLLFPCDQSHHGSVRDLPPSCTHEERKQFMRSTFRFGVPLIDGFHHDVQFAAGRKLGGERFDCSRNGILHLHCTHANVYPDDFVRPSTE